MLYECRGYPIGARLFARSVAIWPTISESLRFRHFEGGLAHAKLRPMRSFLDNFLDLIIGFQLRI